MAKPWLDRDLLMSVVDWDKPDPLKTLSQLASSLDAPLLEELSQLPSPKIAPPDFTELTELFNRTTPFLREPLHRAADARLLALIARQREDPAKARRENLGPPTQNAAYARLVTLRAAQLLGAAACAGGGAWEEAAQYLEDELAEVALLLRPLLARIPGQDSRAVRQGAAALACTLHVACGGLRTAAGAPLLPGADELLALADHMDLPSTTSDTTVVTTSGTTADFGSTAAVAVGAARGYAASSSSSGGAWPSLQTPVAVLVAAASAAAAATSAGHLEPMRAFRQVHKEPCCELLK